MLSGSRAVGVEVDIEPVLFHAYRDCGAGGVAAFGFESGKVTVEKVTFQFEVITHILPGDVGREGVVQMGDEAAFFNERNEFTEVSGDRLTAHRQDAFVNSTPHQKAAAEFPAPFKGIDVGCAFQGPEDIDTGIQEEGNEQLGVPV